MNQSNVAGYVIQKKLDLRLEIIRVHSLVTNLQFQSITACPYKQPRYLVYYVLIYQVGDFNFSSILEMNLLALINDS